MEINAVRMVHQPPEQEPLVLFKQLARSPFSTPAIPVKNPSPITRSSDTGFDNTRGTSSFEPSIIVPQNNQFQANVNQAPTPVQRQKVQGNTKRILSNERVKNKGELSQSEKSEEELQEEIFQEQAKNAHYSFSSSVDDELSDQLVLRQETRDGLNVQGSYSYADGYFQRTVYYEADENGYRVTGDEMKYIGDGPQPNLQGTAHVKSEFGSSRNQYSITAADIESLRKNMKVPIEI